MRNALIHLIIILVVFLLSGCNKADSTLVTGNIDRSSNVAGSEILEGLWTVGGLYYEGNVVDLNDIKSGSMYYGTLISFNNDGTYSYMDGLYSHEGNYSMYNEKDRAFLLSDKIIRPCIPSDDLRTEKSDEKFIFIMQDDDPNTFVMIDGNEIEDKERIDDYCLIFVKYDYESTFIENNKTQIK